MLALPTCLGTRVGTGAGFFQVWMFCCSEGAFPAWGLGALLLANSSLALPDMT